MNRHIVIPDVHGRRFWREAAKAAPDAHIVFLGDYLDPYPQEGIFREEALGELLDIVALKKRYPENVTLLLGNHDLHYLYSKIAAGRYDYENAEIIRALFAGNLDLFDLTYAVETPQRKILLSHAGILRHWAEKYAPALSFNDPGDVLAVAARMNVLIHDDKLRNALFFTLTDTSMLRGGWDSCGSPIWADVEDHKNAFEFQGVYQVFGHTWMEKETITSYWACLDCEKIFILTNTGEIKDYL